MLVDTCSTAVRRGRCELGQDGGEEQAPAAIAIVSWIGHDYRHARVQVGVRREARAAWASRDVYFEAADPELERFRSVGLTIAILIGELPETRALLAEPDASDASPTAAGPAEREPTTPPEVTARSAPPAKPAAPSVAARASQPGAAPSGRKPHAPPPPNGFVSGFVTVGTGLDRGPPRRGGGLWAARALSPLPLWIPLSVAYTWRPREASLKADFLTLRAGVGNMWALTGQRLLLEAEAFVALEQLTASATNPTTGRQDSEQRWAPSLGVGAGPIYCMLPPLCVALEGRVGKSLRTFTVYDVGAVVARTAPWTASVEVGPMLTFQ